MSLLPAFIIFILVLHVHSKDRLQRQSEKCTENFYLESCSDDPDNPILYTQNYNLALTAVYESDCPHTEVNYKWMKGSEEVEAKNDVYFIPPNSLEPGSYSFTVEATIRDNSDSKTATAKCYLDMKKAGMLAVIKGGSERSVIEGRDFLMDGTKSIDIDTTPNETGRLEYKWSCKLLEGSDKDFCRREYKDSTLKVPAKYAIGGYVYSFTLEIKLEEMQDWEESATQIVRIKELVPKITITCEKNCPPKTQSQHLTYLKVKCVENCKNIRSTSYEWTVENVSFDYETSTQFGRNTDKFIVKEGVFQPGTTYTIKVRLIGRNITAVQDLQVYVAVKIESCQIHPSSGVAINTIFTVSCKYLGLGETFEVSTVKSGKSIPLIKTHKLEDLKFRLPVDVKVFIKIEDEDFNFDIYELKTTVSSAIPPGADENEEINTWVQNVKKLVDQESIEEAVQIANGVVEELDKRPSSDERREFKRNILKTFVEAPVTNQTEAQQVYSLVSRLVYNTSVPSDPYQGAMATKACKKGARVDFQHLRNKHYAKNMAAEIKKNTKILMNCGVTDTRANFGNLEKQTLPFEITTPFPLITIPVVEEEYENYDADDIAAEKGKKYEEASDNYVEICHTTLKMMALTVVEGEDTLVSASENVSVQVTRLSGKELVAKEIAIEGASFWASTDLEKVTDDIDVLICCWEKDPFWWNPSGRVVHTNVISIQLRRKGEELSKFVKPFHVLLDVKEHQHLTIHEFEGGNMSVLKVDVKKGESFFVKFHSVCENCIVLITDFDKPDEEDVRSKGLTVTPDKNQFYEEHNREYDGWHYISVLTKTSYQISVHTMSCYSWNSQNMTWIFACKAAINSTQNRIECICHHLSILAGVIYNNPVKLDKITTELDFEMVLLTSPLILICLSIIFSIYCLLLPIVIKQNLRKTINVYIPSDISRYSRYAYFVVIRTGWKLSAGTSSNICLRVFGDKHKSHSHVLNYPDPQKRIFQRGNEDCFIVLTSSHLGNLSEIALWSDYSGRHPRWFCANVAIYDLQDNRKWYFRVNRWLDLPPKAEIYIKVPVYKKEKKKRFERILQNVSRGDRRQDFNFFEKITFALSVCVTIFLVCLVLWGLPRLVLSDGFARFKKLRIYRDIFFFGIVSSVFAFGLHAGLRMLFSKKSKICWFLLIVNVGGCMAVLVVFGCWLPIIMGWLWLLSVILAFLIYFLLLGNIYALIWKLCRKLPKSTDWMNHLKKILESVQEQRVYLFKKLGGNLLRPYFETLYQPMTRDDIQEKKMHAQTRYRIFALLEDTVMFSCYITLLYLAIFAHKNPMDVINHKEMTTLIRSYYHNRIYIHSLDDFYNYVNFSLIPTLHITQWYSKYVVKEPGTMADFNNKFLGVARLRQQRSQTYKCEVPNQLSFLNFTDCRPEFWFAKESRERLRREYNKLSQHSNVWEYSTAEGTGFAMVVGKFGFYSSDGFVAPLGRTLYNSYVKLNYLWENRWLDNATVLVLIEFLGYNVNANLFNAVRCIFETSATGFIKTEVNINTVQLLFVRDEDSVAQLVILNSFALIVVIFTLKLITRFWGGKFLMLQDWWILVDLIIVGMSYGCFGLFIERTHLVKEFLDRLETAKKNEFINYFHLLYVENVFTLVASLLVFISTIRLWKLFRFGTIFRIMEKTLILCVAPFVAMLFCHMVVVLAFSLSGVIIFGTRSEDFKDISESLVSLMRLSTRLVKRFDVRDLVSWNPILGNTFFTAYMFLNLSFHTLYISIIILRYYQAQQIILAQSDFKNLKSFLNKEFGYYKTSLRVALARLHGGTTSTKSKVTAKEDEFRYANCLILPSKILELMRCIAWYDLKKYRIRGTTKTEFMERVAQCCISDSTDEIFIKQKTGRIIKVVHDYKLKRVAFAAELILSYDYKKKQRQELRYRRIMDKKLNKLKYMEDVLKTILHIVSNINIEDK